MRTPVDCRWYDEEKDDERASQIVDVVQQIKNQQLWRQQGYEYHAELYAGGAAAAALHPGMRSGYDYVPAQMPHNIVRQCTNAMVARVCKNRPLPIVQSTAGDWADYKRARKASQFMQGEEYRQRFFAKIRPQVVRDCGVFGAGFVCVRREGKSIHTERVLPTEILVDEWDAQHGDPRNIYRVRDMDRGVAIRRFAKDNEELRNKILDASRIVTPGEEDNGMSSTVDRITVVEAWHLCDDTEAHAPTASKEDRAAHEEECTGRYSCACNTASLDDAPWRRGYFPFPKLDFEPPLGGFVGQGLAEQLEGYQYAINDIEMRVQESMQFAPGALLITDGDIPDTHINNGNFPVLKATQRGARMDVVQVKPIHDQFIIRQRDLIDSSYTESGQTSFGVSGEKPHGLISSVALREVEEQESGRHVVLFRNDEEFCREVGRQWVDCVKEIAEEYGDASVAVPMSDGLLALKWSECDLETYEVRVFSGSMLPQQRAARMDTLVDWFDRGIIDRGTFMQQLEQTDIEQMADMDIAGDVLVDEQLESMLLSSDPLDEESYIPPSPFVDPVKAKARAQKKRMWAQLRKAPPAALALLDRFIVDCSTLKDEAMAAAPPLDPMSPPPGGMLDPLAPPPGAPPGMPPGAVAPDAMMGAPGVLPQPPVMGNA